jgi:AcrR family transcriptional regulator
MDTQPQRRPGGRTAEISNRINNAVLEILAEEGVEACTFATVAAHARIERSTLYRRYSDRWAMMIDAVIEKTGVDLVPDDSGNFAEDLRSVLLRLVEILETKLGVAIFAALGALHSTSDVARTYFDERMKQLQPMFDRAVDRGELRDDIDPEEVFTFASGAVWFRRFVASRPVTSDFIDRVTDSVCTVYECGSADAAL